MDAGLSATAAWESVLEGAAEVAYRGVEPARAGRAEPLPDGLHPDVAAVLEAHGVTGLYAHQAETWEAAARGENVVVTTGTASGKSLAFSLPALDAIARELPLRASTTLQLSSVIGMTRAGQLRRDFLAYVERERAHPYRPFLHYNSWYDLGYFSKFNEPEALAVIAAFGAELQRKRGVELDSFLFDDGWDDPKTLWGFHRGFPRGFSGVRDAAARYGAATIRAAVGELNET